MTGTRAQHAFLTELNRFLRPNIAGTSPAKGFQSLRNYYENYFSPIPLRSHDRTFAHPLLPVYFRSDAMPSMHETKFAPVVLIA